MPKQKDKTSRGKTTGEPYPRKGEKPDGEDTLYCDRCTSAVEQLIQCEKCEMYLCSGCEKVPENVMIIVGEYNQMHWFCQYCDPLVSKAL